jgi:N-acetylglucosaminyldiphosphoundecaprenol N-acetyl-beta-D-mannosaminyltransferase
MDDEPIHSVFEILDLGTVIEASHRDQRDTKSEGVENAETHAARHEQELGQREVRHLLLVENGPDAVYPGVLAGGLGNQAMIRTRSQEDDFEAWYALTDKATGFEQKRNPLLSIHGAREQAHLIATDAQALPQLARRPQVKASAQSTQGRGVNGILNGRDPGFRQPEAANDGGGRLSVGEEPMRVTRLKSFCRLPYRGPGVDEEFPAVAPEGQPRPSRKRECEENVVHQQPARLLDDHQIRPKRCIDARLPIHVVRAEAKDSVATLHCPRQVDVVPLGLFATGRLAVDQAELDTLGGKPLAQQLVEGSPVLRNGPVDDEHPRPAQTGILESHAAGIVAAMPVPPNRPRVLGMRVDAPTVHEAAAQIMEWASEGSSRMICAANVHMVMEAHDDAEFREQINGADLVLPDGVPLVWALHMLGITGATRVRVSPDFLVELFLRAESGSVRVGLYGGTPQTLAAFIDVVGSAIPALEVSYAYAPPFRALTRAEDEAVIQEIDESGCQLLLVGIGCPKQEKWMAAHRDRLPCAMMGVGAAFDLFGGKTHEAPLWIQPLGLEWLYRLTLEPRRLWRRHLKHNPRFVVLFGYRLLSGRDWGARR